MKFLRALIFLSPLSAGSARADFKISTKSLNEVPALTAACSQQRSEMGMDIEKATAMLLWIAFCRSDVVEAQLLRELLYSPSPQGLVDPEGNVVSKHEKIISFLNFFTQDFDLTNSLPGRDFPLYVKQVPLLTFGADPASQTSTVWTGYPTQLPIADLLGDPSSLGLYCASSDAPSGFDGNFSICGVEDLSDDTTLSLPSIPAVPSIQGVDPALLSRCHQLRVKAARDGQISHQELFDLTRENSVPVFQVPGDDNSSVIGFEPCVFKHRLGVDTKQAAIREAVKNVKNIQVSIKGKNLTLAVPKSPSFSIKKVPSKAQTLLDEPMKQRFDPRQGLHDPLPPNVQMPVPMKF